MAEALYSETSPEGLAPAREVLKILPSCRLPSGVFRFVITDDKLVRNRNWEAIFDRLIEMREKERLELQFII